MARGPSRTTLITLKATRKAHVIASEVLYPPTDRPRLQGPDHIQHDYTKPLEIDWAVAGALVITAGVIAWVIYGVVSGILYLRGH